MGSAGLAPGSCSRTQNRPIHFKGNQARAGPEAARKKLGGYGLESRREMTQKRGLVNQFEATNFVAATPDIEDDFNDVFHVALGIHAAGNGQANQVHGGVLAKHERADLDRADPAFEVKFHRECYARELRHRNVREKGAGIEINRMTARRLDDRNAFARDVIAEEGRRCDAVFQVLLFECFIQTYGDGIQITPCEPAIRWKPFGEDQQVFLLLGEDVVVGAKETADVGKAVFLRGHGAAIGIRKHFAGDLARSLVGETRFTRFYEVSVFSEAAGIDVQGNTMFLADLLYFTDVGHGHGLAAAGVVGDREHHEWNFFCALTVNQLFKANGIHVSFEGIKVCGLFGFGRGQVDRLGANEFAIGAGGVEVRVVWDQVAFLASDIKKDALCGTALVRGNHVAKSKNALYRIAEAREAR